MATTHTVRAAPLTGAAFAPFGQVIGAGDAVMELRDEEVFHLNVLHHDRRPLRCDHLNRHLAYLDHDLDAVVEVLL